jgi:hypothetical protein
MESNLKRTKTVVFFWLVHISLIWFSSCRLILELWFLMVVYMGCMCVIRSFHYRKTEHVPRHMNTLQINGHGRRQIWHTITIWTRQRVRKTLGNSQDTTNIPKNTRQRRSTRRNTAWRTTLTPRPLTLRLHILILSILLHKHLWKFSHSELMLVVLLHS